MSKGAQFGDDRLGSFEVFFSLIVPLEYEVAQPLYDVTRLERSARQEAGDISIIEPFHSNHQAGNLTACWFDATRYPVESRYVT